ncbi:MAG: hypothetical protein IPH61_06260 [Bacteroidetes bacterium]|nr:hypothetical protein [Bacteroidota bacterium]
MATTNTTKQEFPNHISGKISLKDTGAGIPNLLVIIYDLDPGAKPEEFINSLSVDFPKAKAIIKEGEMPKNTLGFLGDRLGSVLTTADGTFELNYENKEFQVLTETEKRPDLFLMVLAPEEAGRSFANTILYYSSEIRQNAGRNENYFIQLTDKTFIEKNIEIPKTNSKPDPTNVIENFKALESFNNAFNAELLVHEKEKVTQKKAKLVKSKKVFRQIFAPKPVPNDGSFVTFVEEEERVADKLNGHMGNQMIKKNNAIQNHINENKGIEVSFVLNPANIIALGLETSSETNKLFNDIQTTEPLKSLLHKMNAAGSNNLILTSTNPIIKSLS